MPAARLPRLAFALAVATVLAPVAPALAGAKVRPPARQPSPKPKAKPKRRNPIRPASTPTPPAAAPASSSTAEVAIQLFVLTNARRVENGLPPLEVDVRLVQAAQIQADTMALFDRMEHRLADASLPSLASRLQYVGYGPAWAAENIATGCPDAPAVAAMWMDSPIHRQNILNPIYTALGVAVAFAPDGTPYYCEVLGREQGK